MYSLHTAAKIIGQMKSKYRMLSLIIAVNVIVETYSLNELVLARRADPERDRGSGQPWKITKGIGFHRNKH